MCVLKGRILSCGCFLAFRPACRRATFPGGEGEAETSPGRLQFWQPAGGHSLMFPFFILGGLFVKAKVAVVAGGLDLA